MGMRQGVVVVVAAATALSAAAAMPGRAALAVRAGGGVGTSIVTSVSCTAAGDCAAGGSFMNQSAKIAAFVVTERRGRWDKAIFVPGLAALRALASQVNAVSCGSAGNCAGGGSYETSSGLRTRAFVVSERDGRWARLITVSRKPPQFLSEVDSVSCPAAGNCVAVGGDTAFLVSEVHGRWGRARPIPGLASLGGPQAAVSASCGSVGNCLAGGDYVARTGPTAFVVSEKHGRWNRAFQVPGLAALGEGSIFGHFAQLGSVSCASAGNCAVGGDYIDASGAMQVFVVGERNGRWGKAIEVPGIAALNTAGSAGLAAINSVSCASAGNCVAGGFYETRFGLCAPGSGGGLGVCQAFVVSEKNGRWGKAIKVPGTASLNTGGLAAVTSVSCALAGDCVAGGFYSQGRTGPQLGFVVAEKNGRWGKAIEVPGLASLQTARFLEVNAVSCASAGNCAAVGGYNSGAEFACPTPTCPGFVVSQKHGIWRREQTVRF